MAPLFTANWFNFGRTPVTDGVVNVNATGGNSVVTPGDGFKYHIFTSSGSFVVNTNDGAYGYEVFLVGGGGGGGRGGDGWGGAGGAGGAVWMGSNNQTVQFTNGTTNPVTIGSGGAVQTNGGNTLLVMPQGSFTFDGEGGGYGGSRSAFNPPGQVECSPGGCGGGRGVDSGSCPGTQPTASQGPGQPPPWATTRVGQPAPPPNNCNGGSANPNNDRTANWDLPIISGAFPTGVIGRGGPGTLGGPGQPPQPAATWSGTPVCYGSGGNGGRGAGGTGADGCVVVRYAWYE